MKATAITTCVLAAIGCFVLIGGCHSWELNQTVDGIAYSRVRRETIQGEEISIGQLTRDVEIDGRTYTGWLHRRGNGSISGGMIARDTVINGISVPASTWVGFDANRKLTACHFPENQTIQGHVCRGTGGGIKGATVKFYPSGKLRLFFAPKDVSLQGVPCKGGLFHYVELYESGRLKKCTLSDSATIDGRELTQGTTVVLDEAGHVRSASGA